MGCVGQTAERWYLGYQEWRPDRRYDAACPGPPPASPSHTLPLLLNIRLLNKQSHSRLTAALRAEGRQICNRMRGKGGEPAVAPASSSGSWPGFIKEGPGGCTH